MESIEKWIIKLKETDHLYFYGAGKIAGRLLRFCREENITVEGVIVTEPSENPSNLEGVEVHGYGEMDDSVRARANVYVALTGGSRKWIDSFLETEFGSIRFFPQDFLNDLAKWENERRLFEQFGNCFAGDENEYRLEQNYPYAERSQYNVIEKNSNMPVARLNRGKDCEDISILCNELKNGAPLNMFGNMKHSPCSWEGYRYGEMINLKGVIIYVVTSAYDNMDVKAEQKGIYCPIQAGASLASVRKPCIGDDERDNISNRNSNYSECSALYWMWKNDQDNEYVGLEHYRRRLGLNQDAVRQIADQKKDMCIVTPQYTALSVRSFFLQYISEGDWKLFKELFCNLKPEKADMFEQYENGHFYLPCNVGLWKKTWLDQYCSWAFRIAEDMNRYYEDRHIMREDRYMGYIFENMYSLAILEDISHLNLVYTDIMQVC